MSASTPFDRPGIRLALKALHPDRQCQHPLAPQAFQRALGWWANRQQLAPRQEPPPPPTPPPAGTGRAPQAFQPPPPPPASTGRAWFAPQAFQPQQPPPPPPQSRLAKQPATGDELSHAWLQSTLGGMYWSMEKYEHHFGRVSKLTPWGETLWQGLQDFVLNDYLKRSSGWWLANTLYTKFLGTFTPPANFSKRGSQDSVDIEPAGPVGYPAIIFYDPNNPWYVVVCIKIAISMSKPWYAHPTRVELHSRL